MFYGVKASKYGGGARQKFSMLGRVAMTRKLPSYELVLSDPSFDRRDTLLIAR
jgi:hypothetical protein